MAKQFSLSSDYKKKLLKSMGCFIFLQEDIQEEGLQLAAMHHERLANTATALSLFSQVRECYKRF
jgi:hypothetical protein